MHMAYDHDVPNINEEEAKKIAEEAENARGK